MRDIWTCIFNFSSVTTCLCSKLVPKIPDQLCPVLLLPKKSHNSLQGSGWRIHPQYYWPLENPLSWTCFRKGSGSAAKWFHVILHTAATSIFPLLCTSQEDRTACIALNMLINLQFCINNITSHAYRLPLVPWK